MGFNLMVILLYWYFCAIIYEYYFLACNDVYLRDYERKTIAKEQKKIMQQLAVELELNQNSFIADDSVELFKDMPTNKDEPRKTFVVEKINKLFDKADKDTNPLTRKTMAPPTRIN